MIHSLILLLASTCAWGQDPQPQQKEIVKIVATVLWVRGAATLLPPNSKEIVPVAKGMALREDSSILTGKKGVVKVRFLTGHKLLIGPQSKMAITESSDSQTNLLYLFKGKIRAEVKKIKGKKSTFYIKSKSAAIGVRGTDFLAIHNINGDSTSVLTYRGEVAMSKLPLEMREDPFSEAKKAQATLENIIEVLNSQSDSVVITKGRFAAVTPNFEKPTIPIKISPKQFYLLRQNIDMEENLSTDQSITKKMPDETLDEVIEELNAVKTVDANPNGELIVDTGQFAPKAGGLIDTDTGMYFAPSKEAEFMESYQVFEADKTIGQINVKNGSYIPPQGTRVDPVYGLVDDSSMEQKSKAIRVDDLNSELSKTFKIKRPLEQLESSKQQSLPAKQEKGPDEVVPKKQAGPKWVEQHLFNFKMGPMYQDLKAKFKVFDATREFESEPSLYLKATYGQKYNQNFQSVFAFEFRHLRYKNRSDFPRLADELDPLFRLFIGGKYFFWDFLNMALYLSIGDEYHFFVNSTSSQLFFLQDHSLEIVFTPEAKWGFEGRIHSSPRLFFDLNAYLVLLAGDSGREGLEAGVGVELLGGPNVVLSKKCTVNLYGLFEYNAQDSRIVDLERTTKGFGVSLSWNH